MSAVGRPKGGNGYGPGELETAISVCLYRSLERLTVAEIARKTGGHPTAVRAALNRMLKTKQVDRYGTYKALWTVNLL